MFVNVKRPTLNQPLIDKFKQQEKDFVYNNYIGVADNILNPAFPNTQT